MFFIDMVGVETKCEPSKRESASANARNLSAPKTKKKDIQIFVAPTAHAMSCYVVAIFPPFVLVCYVCSMEHSLLTSVKR
jgi:hypothetical protein